MKDDLVDLKADTLSLIASTLESRNISGDLHFAEFIDHEEPAVLLNVFRYPGFGKPDLTPIARVRIDVTVEEIDDRR